MKEGRGVIVESQCLGHGFGAKCCMKPLPAVALAVMHKTGA